MTDSEELFPDDESDQPSRPPVKTINEMTDAEREALAKRWSKPRAKRGKARTPENSVRDKIESWLKSAGVLYRRYNAGHMTIDNGDGTSRIVKLGDAGTSDYLAEVTIEVEGVLIGVFCAIEAKAPGNTPTPLQAKFLNSVKARGGIAIIATNALDVETAINNYRNELCTRLRIAFWRANRP